MSDNTKQTVSRDDSINSIIIIKHSFDYYTWKISTDKLIQNWPIIPLSCNPSTNFYSFSYDVVVSHSESERDGVSNQELR